jgi:hypothetical protein
VAARSARLGNKLQLGKLFYQLSVDMCAFTNQDQYVRVLQPYGQLPQTLHRIGVDLGLIGLKLAGTFQLTHCVLVIVKYHNIHNPNCALPQNPADAPRHSGRDTMSLQFNIHRKFVMSLSMSSASLPVFILMLRNLSHMLDKAQHFVDSKGCDPLALTQYRLAPDMLPFARQILIACDAAKNGIARLSGVEAPKFADEEQTLAELKARIAKTLSYLATVPAESLNGTEDKAITFPVGKDSVRTMQGQAYLTQWVLPNLFFHITTAYNILRHNGVDLGKRDYLLGATAP